MGQRDRIPAGDEKPGREQKPRGGSRSAPGLAESILTVQRQAGNQVADSLMVQAKLTVGYDNDPLEREADSVAASIMRRMQAPAGAGPGLADEAEARPAIQRKSVGGPDPLGGMPVDPGAEAEINQARRGGRPVPGEVRKAAESVLGTDLGGVRIHHDARSDELSQSLQAKAFTTGSDIFFQKGGYDRETLAHELGHVVQQGGTVRREKTKSKSSKKHKGEDYRIERSPEYQQAAAEFEQRLGVYAYKHKLANDAASNSLLGMRENLLGGPDMVAKLASPKDKEEELAIKRAITGAFGRNSPASAGQVGQIFKAVDDVFRSGNLRERMTAFFNAASNSFKTLVADMLKSKSWDQAGAEGLDVKAMKKRQSLQKGTVNKLGAFVEKQKTGMNRAFGKDLYIQDPKAILKSGQKSALTGSTARQWEDKSSQRTAGDIEKEGYGLSQREKELSFGDKAKGDVKDEKLPWKEGGTVWSIDTGHSYYKEIHDKLGMPVVAGPSGTTSFLLDAFKFLNLPGKVNPPDFRLALLGWMMTSNDHSFHEIMQMAATKGLGLDYKAGTDAYHDIAPLTTAELRSKVAVNRNLPDEAVYQKMIGDDGMRLPKLRDDVKTGETMYGELAADAPEKEALGPGAAASIGTYAASGYLVMNPMEMKTLPGWIRKLVIRHQIKNEEELRALKAADQGGRLSVTALMAEGKLHNRILHRVLMDLPPWKGTVYRGHWMLPGEYRKGKKVTYSGFTSTSTNMDVAKDFLKKPVPGSSRVLFEMELTDGRNIAALNPFGEEEILMTPGTSFKVIETPKTEKIDIEKKGKKGTKVTQQVDMVRVKLKQVGGSGAKGGAGAPAPAADSAQPAADAGAAAAAPAAKPVTEFTIPPSASLKLWNLDASGHDLGSITAKAGTELTATGTYGDNGGTVLVQVLVDGHEFWAMDDQWKATMGSAYPKTTNMGAAESESSETESSETESESTDSLESASQGPDLEDILDAVHYSFKKTKTTTMADLPSTKGVIPAGTEMYVIDIEGSMVKVDVAKQGYKLVAPLDLYAATQGTLEWKV
jgi:hypothetical protein